MLRSVLLKALRDQRWGLLWWSVGLVGVAIAIILFYPSVRDNPAIEEYLEQLPEGFLTVFVGEVSSYTTPEGYLRGELFSFMAPLLFLIVTIAMGSGAIAGEEQRGTLELLLSHPVSRWQVVVQKFAAMAIVSLLLGIIFWAGMVVGAAAIDMDIGLGRLAQWTVSVGLVAMAFGTLALALGCASGNRGLSVGLTSGLAVAAYLFNALAPLADALEPFRKASPFYYYMGADPVVRGLDPVDVAVLMGLAMAFLVAALVTFQRRDIAV